MENIFKPNSWVISARSGHGKDYIAEIIAEIYRSHLHPVQYSSFSSTMKELTSNLIPSNILNSDRFSNLNRLEVLLDLKDSSSEKIIGDYDARRLLQILGNEFFRELNPQIHILFEAEKHYKSLIENDLETVFICTDNRYYNERQYWNAFNSIKDKAVLLDFILHYVKSNHTPLNLKEIKNKFSQSIGVKTPQTDWFCESVAERLEMLTLLPEPSVSRSDLEIDRINLAETPETLFEHGFIHAFRPLIDPKTKHIAPNQLEDSILEYNGMERSQLGFIKEKYKEYGLPFDLENISKYGFLRANPFHQSEMELIDNLEGVILNTPMSHGRGAKEFIEANFNRLNKDLEKKNKQDSRRDQLNISVPTSLMLNTENIEDLHKQYSLKVYHETIKAIWDDGHLLDKGALANLSYYISAINLITKGKSQIPEIRLGVVTKNSPSESALLHQSLRKHKILPAFMAYTGGEKRSDYAKQFQIDLAITHSQRSRDDHMEKGIRAYSRADVCATIEKLDSKPTARNVLNTLKDLFPEGNSEYINKIFSELEKSKLLDTNFESFVVNEQDLKITRDTSLEVEPKPFNRISAIFDAKTLYFEDNGTIKPSLTLAYLKSLSELNNAIRDTDYLVEIGVLSPNPDDQIKIFTLLKNAKIDVNHVNFYDEMPDYNPDIFFVENSEYAHKLLRQGIPAIHSARDAEWDLNDPSVNVRKLHQVFDIDEVVVQHEESLFKLRSLRFFNAYQKIGLNIPFEHGPLYNYLEKIGVLAKYVKEQNLDYQIKITALTSRGGGYPALRFMTYMEENSLQLDAALFLDGLEKTKHLVNFSKDNSLIMFIDDHPLHLERASKSVESKNIKNIMLYRCNGGINSSSPQEQSELEQNITNLLSKTTVKANP